MSCGHSPAFPEQYSGKSHSLVASLHTDPVGWNYRQTGCWVSHNNNNIKKTNGNAIFGQRVQHFKCSRAPSLKRGDTDLNPIVNRVSGIRTSLFGLLHLNLTPSDAGSSFIILVLWTYLVYLSFFVYSTCPRIILSPIPLPCTLNPSRLCSLAAMHNYFAVLCATSTGRRALRFFCQLACYRIATRIVLLTFVVTTAIAFLVFFYNIVAAFLLRIIGLNTTTREKHNGIIRVNIMLFISLSKFFCKFPPANLVGFIEQALVPSVSEYFYVIVEAAFAKFVRLNVLHAHDRLLHYTAVPILADTILSWKLKRVHRYCSHVL